MVYSAKGKGKRFKIFVLIFVIILTLIIAMINRMISQHYEDIAIQEGKKISANILTNCISEIINKENLSVNNLVNISYNSDGEILSLETNADVINKIQLEIMDNINEKLTNTDINTSEIPIGTLTDFPLFVGEGPKVKIKYSLNGSAKVELVSKLESGGINQTLHKIIAHIQTEIYSVSPIETSKITYSFDYLLCETVIVGDVPSILSQNQRNI